MARAPRRPRPQRRQRRRRAAGRQSDSAALRGIKQGVGQSVVRAFGSLLPRRNRRRGRGMRGAGTAYHPCFHDAFHMCHLPLPRPTGPYTVIRTTQLVTEASGLALLGPTFDRGSNQWTNHCGYFYNDFNKTGATSNNLKAFKFSSMIGGSWNGVQLTPAAFSVQLMNPGALQTTEGIVYSGRIRTAYKMSENTGTTGLAIAQQFISYNNPRLLAAAKLAFRGVQIDEVPFNMSDLANFTSLKDEVAGDFTGSAAMNDNHGFAPVFVYNPNKINLQYLICCEWRVRFDPSNPAQASHVQHSHADESIWMKCLHAAESVGNGVVDIADKVAETGNAVFGAAAGAYRGARGMRALTAGVGQLALT